MSEDVSETSQHLLFILLSSVWETLRSHEIMKSEFSPVKQFNDSSSILYPPAIMKSSFNLKKISVEPKELKNKNVPLGEDSRKAFLE